MKSYTTKNKIQTQSKQHELSFTQVQRIKIEEYISNLQKRAVFEWVAPLKREAWRLKKTVFKHSES